MHLGDANNENITQRMQRKSVSKGPQNLFIVSYGPVSLGFDL